MMFEISSLRPSTRVKVSQFCSSPLSAGFLCLFCSPHSVSAAPAALDPAQPYLWIAVGLIVVLAAGICTFWRRRFPVIDLDGDGLNEGVFNIENTLNALKSPVEKAIRLVDHVRLEMERNLLCSMVPFFWRYFTIRRQCEALERVQSLLSSPNPLHIPNLMEEIKNGHVDVDNETQQWLSYELAKKSSMGWGNSPDDDHDKQGRASRSQSISVMRNSNDASDVRSLSTIGSWSFDVFALVEESNEELPLAAVGFCLFLKFNLFKKLHLDMDSVEDLMFALDDSYRKNPYHNSLHAADVAQTTSFLLEQTGCLDILRPLDHATLILAALCHDIDHPGTTNGFQMMTHSNLAMLYNDRSVLENHHASFSRRLFRRPNLDIFKHLPGDERHQFEELFMESVLATDISSNFEVCAQFRRAQKVTNSRGSSSFRGSRGGSVEDNHHATLRSFIMKRETLKLLSSMLLKCADVGHCGKKWDVHKRFSDAIQEEFYLQGDQERELELPISPYMDRMNVGNVAKNQLGFFEFLVQPMLATISTVIPLKPVIEGVESNLSEWKRRAEDWNRQRRDEGSTGNPVKAAEEETHESSEKQEGADKLTSVLVSH